MNAQVRILALFATCCGSLPAALLDESFSGGLPGDFSVLNGSASVTGGILSMDSACVQLPGSYTRDQGLTITARIRINDGGIGDFHMYGLYDALPDCHAGPTNGYYTGWYPGTSDNPNDIISVVTGGVHVLLDFTPSSIVAGQWYVVRETFLPNGAINSYLDGSNANSASNSARTAGLLAIRSWQNVEVDWIRVEQVPEPSTFGTIGGGIACFMLFRKRIGLP